MNVTSSTNHHFNKSLSNNTVNSTTGSSGGLANTPDDNGESISYNNHYGNGNNSINKSASFIFDRNLMKPSSKLIHSYSTSTIVKNPHSTADNTISSTFNNENNFHCPDGNFGFYSRYFLIHFPYFRRFMAKKDSSAQDQTESNYTTTTTGI